MSNQRVEDVINEVLKGDSQKNALDLIAHLRVSGASENLSIEMHDGKDESGWIASDFGFIFINGSDEFPGPWTMWMGVDNIGERSEAPIDEHIKDFAWSNVSPCGSCGCECSPGISTKIFGKDFENTCQSNLIFVNPNAEAVDYMKKIIDIRKNDIQYEK